MKLDETISFPEYSFTSEYHNTWNLTVSVPH
jgi:hypothetical protein